MLRGLGLAMAILVFTTPAQANVLIPLMGASWIGMVMMLVPIVLGESLVRSLQLDILFLRSLWVAGVANLGSTLLGIPAAIFSHGAVESIALRSTRTWVGKFHWAVVIAPWDIGSHDQPDEETDRDWITLVAFATILAVFFAASWVSEAIVALHMLDGFQPERVWTAIATVNAATYCMIGAFLVYRFVTTPGMTNRDRSTEIYDDDLVIVNEEAGDREAGGEDKLGGSDCGSDEILPFPDHQDAA
jgi:hypothetical protein